MRRIKGAKPSPALLVAVVALVAALGGGAVAGVAVTALNKKEKKQVTKISKKQANRQIKRKEPGLDVNSAVRAETAKDADNAVNAQNAATAANAGDADKLDGLDASSLIRVAGDSSEDLEDGGVFDTLSADITAPRSGFLHIVGSVDLENFSVGDTLQCELRLADSSVSGSVREIDLDGDLTDDNDVNTQEVCATNAVVAVGAGVHTVDLNLIGLVATTDVDAGALNVLFVPFGDTGD